MIAVIDPGMSPDSVQAIQVMNTYRGSVTCSMFEFDWFEPVVDIMKTLPEFLIGWKGRHIVTSRQVARRIYLKPIRRYHIRDKPSC